MGIRNGAKGERHSHDSSPPPPPGCGSQPPLPKALPGDGLSPLPLLEPTALNYFSPHASRLWGQQAPLCSLHPKVFSFHTDTPIL